MNREMMTAIGAKVEFGRRNLLKYCAVTAMIPGLPKFAILRAVHESS